MSGSIHIEAEYSNLSVNSTPCRGSTRKIPGCGGPFVTIVTEEKALRLLDESRLANRVNVNVALSGSEFGEITRFDVV
jgi:hypothetical protein